MTIQPEPRSLSFLAPLIAAGIGVHVDLLDHHDNVIGEASTTTGRTVLRAHFPLELMARAHAFRVRITEPEPGAPAARPVYVGELACGCDVPYPTYPRVTEDCPSHGLQLVAVVRDEAGQ